MMDSRIQGRRAKLSEDTICTVSFLGEKYKNMRENQGKKGIKRLPFAGPFLVFFLYCLFQTFATYFNSLYDEGIRAKKVSAFAVLFLIHFL